LETIFVHEWRRPLQHDKYRSMAILLSENFRAVAGQVRERVQSTRWGPIIQEKGIKPE
jgi:hypothetical protein